MWISGSSVHNGNCYVYLCLDILNDRRSRAQFRCCTPALHQKLSFQYYDSNLCLDTSDIIISEEITAQLASI